MTLSCRVTAEEWEQVVASAHAAGRDVSEHMRAAVFAEIHASAEALEAARREVAKTVGEKADRQRRALQAELDDAKKNWAGWQRRAQEHEQDLLFVSVHVIRAARAVLAGHPGSRSELARLWACLSVEERLRLLPMLAQVALEQLERLRETTHGWLFVFERDRKALLRVLSLMESVRPRAGFAANAQLLQAWRLESETVGAAFDAAVIDIDEARHPAGQSPETPAAERSAP